MIRVCVNKTNLMSSFGDKHEIHAAETQLSCDDEEVYSLSENISRSYNYLQFLPPWLSVKTMCKKVK